MDHDEDFTPITDVLALAETPRERDLVHRIWAHTANMELRARRRLDACDAGQLRQDVDELHGAVIDIRGTSGTNGKLGELTRRVDKAESRRWWALTFAAGLLVTVITSALVFGRWMGRIETEVVNLKLSSPADAPGKDTP